MQALLTKRMQGSETIYQKCRYRFIPISNNKQREKYPKLGNAEFRKKSAKNRTKNYPQVVENGRVLDKHLV